VIHGTALEASALVHRGAHRPGAGPKRQFRRGGDATWLARREFLTCAGAAVLGWVFGIVAFERHSVRWDSSLVLSLAGALLCTTLYWLITRGGRSIVLLGVLIFILPAVTGLVVAR
jgi:hypothetical protein